MDKPRELAMEIARILDNKGGMNIQILQVDHLTSITDYFVIASATSNTHTKALADDVEYEIKQRLDIAPEHIEGRATGWILLDYGTVIVHIFQHEDREYYNLERLWADAKVIDLSDVITPE